MRIAIVLPVAAAAALAACGSSGDTGADAEATPFEFPPSLSPFGDGYPVAGDPCRQIGESEAVVDLLDDSAMLIGCPTVEQAEALGGSLVATIDGVSLVSVPMGDANAGMGETGDALVAGTDYNATAILSCAFDGATSFSDCNAGVKRNWGDEGTSLVEVSKPDGTTRAIFFNGTEATGADSAQADGSAGWDFKVERKGDESTVTFGPEKYIIPDALVVGG